MRKGTPLLLWVWDAFVVAYAPLKGALHTLGVIDYTLGVQAF